MPTLFNEHTLKVTSYKNKSQDLEKVCWFSDIAHLTVKKKHIDTYWYTMHLMTPALYQQFK